MRSFEIALLTPRVVTAAEIEPVSVAEFKSHALKLGTDQDATTIPLYIAAARRDFESWTGRTIHQTEYELTLEDWPTDGLIILPRATPLIELVSVIYTDSTGAPTTWDNSLYVTDAGNRDTLARLAPAYGESWPSFTPYPLGPIKIRYSAGLAASPAVEADQQTKLLILLMTAAMFDAREPEAMSNQSAVEMAWPGLARQLNSLKVNHCA